jgi:rhamnulokinase
MEALIRRALDKCATQGPLDGVGVDSWGVDYVLLDEQLRRVGPAICYRDRRTAGFMERVQAQRPAAEIYRRTGIQFQPFNTLYQLAAAAEQEPEWMRTARHLLMIPDYLHFRLSGVLSNEYTNATTTQMVGLDGAWDPTLLQAAGIRPELLRPLTAAGTVLGEMQIGAERAAVIAPASHDTASAVAGTPLEGPDEAFISSGTWSLMGVESQAPIATDAALRMNFTNEGGLERRFRVLKNLTGMWPLQRICAEQRIHALDTLISQAEGVSAWRSLVNFDQPYFLNPVSMTGAIRRACRASGQPEPVTPAQLARCIFDSLALSYRKVKEELQTLRGRDLTRIRIVGGGSRNRLLNQICADACQLPVSAGPVEASALGNLCAQWMALGEISNLDAARALIRASFPPGEFPPRAAIPASAWERFQALLDQPLQEEEKCR